MEDLDRYEYFVGRPLLIAEINTKIRERVCLTKTNRNLLLKFLFCLFFISPLDDKNTVLLKISAVQGKWKGQNKVNF